MRLVIDEKQLLGAKRDRLGEACWIAGGGGSQSGAHRLAGKTAIQVVSRDITERKQIEKTLQDADRRKDEFLATLAHDCAIPWRRSATACMCSDGMGRKASARKNSFQ